jgi:hypothetical protein
VAKLTRAMTQPVYDAAPQFVDRCLRLDDSLFTPGRAIWSLAVCQDLHARFVGQPDTSKDTFENKFRRQLAEAPPATIQLAAELLFVHLLAARQVLFDTKRSLIQHVLGWSAQPVAFPEQLLPALRDGLASTGMAFLTYRPQQLALLLEFTNVKYKLSKGEWNRPDLYQLVTFATTFGSKSGALVSFVPSGAKELPSLRVGEVVVNHVAWPADPALTPEAAASAFIDSAGSWLGQVASDRRPAC